MTAYLSRTLMDPTEDFVKQIKDVLDNLYDFAHLQRHPLAEELILNHALPGETAGQCLRRHVINAVEKLNPGGDLSLRTPQARGYNLLHLRYVEGMTIQEAAYEVGISERQAYRHLISVRESLASILWRQFPEFHNTHAAPEVELSDPPPTSTPPVNIKELVEHAHRAVVRLAEQRALRIDMQLCERPIILSANRTIAKQVLINLLSRCIQHSNGDHLTLKLTCNSQGSLLTLTFAASGEFDTDPVVNELIGQLGWTIQHHPEDKAQVSIVLDFLHQQPVLLVIDDEENLGELVERYLTDHPFQIVREASGKDGLAKAQTMRPTLIILDVMMPGMDGWEVLQRLQSNPRTASIKVLICSIFNDPELALSLGASGFLAKPFNQQDLLKMLAQLGVF